MDSNYVSDLQSFTDAGTFAPIALDTGAFTQRTAGYKSTIDSSIPLPDLKITAAKNDTNSGVWPEVPSIKEMNKILEQNGEKPMQLPTNSEFEAKVMQFDKMLPDKAFEKSVRSVDLLLQALEGGYDVKVGADGKPELDRSMPLSPDRRWEFHKAVICDMETMFEQMNSRLVFGQHLLQSGQLYDFAAWQLSALGKATRLATPIQMFDGRSSSPIQLMEREAVILGADQGKYSDPAKVEAIKGAKDTLDSPNGQIALIKSLAELATRKK